MNNTRVVTNLVKLVELKQKPCEKWLKYFDKNGVADAHEAFISEYDYPYTWLYENTNIDLISWEIENNCFDWENNSWVVAKYCPDKLDPDRFNWESASWAVVQFCPDKFDPDRFNWKRHSWAVAEYCPDKLDPDRFNWREYSWALAIYSINTFAKYPERIDKESIRLFSYNKRRKLLSQIRSILNIPKGVRNETSIKFRKVLLNKN